MCAFLLVEERSPSTFIHPPLSPLWIERFPMTRDYLLHAGFGAKIMAVSLSSLQHIAKLQCSRVSEQKSDMLLDTCSSKRT